MSRTFDKIETIDKIIEICIDFKKDMIETGNELIKDEDEQGIINAITHAFYMLGFRKNGWINFSPYNGDYSLLTLFIKENVMF